MERYEACWGVYGVSSNLNGRTSTICPVTIDPFGSWSPFGSTTTCMVLAVTTSPAFAFAAFSVWVKITGIVVWAGSVIARLAGTIATLPSRARNERERE